MKTKHIFYLLLLCALSACNSTSNEKDLEAPEILAGTEGAGPLNCAVYHLGSTLIFQYSFLDNMELGSYNLEIHNNFDHHTHSTEAETCQQDPVKKPVNPWIYNKDFHLPAGEKMYDAYEEIKIPEDVDPGEYHFMIRLTDASGWQTLKSVSIRLAE